MIPLYLKLLLKEAMQIILPKSIDDSNWRQQQ